MTHSLNGSKSPQNVEYASNQVLMTANEYVLFYLQFQSLSTATNIIASALQVRCSSLTAQHTKIYISSTNMARDNTVSLPPSMLSVPDQLSLFSSSSGLSDVQSGQFSVGSSGSLSVSASSGSVLVGSCNDLNIAGHNGTRGLKLGGTLVTASAAEINYLSGSSPGTFKPCKAIVLDQSGELTGFARLGGTHLTRMLTTTEQPNIKSLGPLTATLSTSADVVLTSTNTMRLAPTATALCIQPGVYSSPNSSCDLFIGNTGATVATSPRKLMIKGSGFVGVQSSAPTRALTINGTDAAYCMRSVNNASDGTDPKYCDIGVDESSNLVLSTSSSGLASIGVSSTGMLKITSSGSSIQIGNTTNRDLPLELGLTSYTLSGTVVYFNSNGRLGTQPIATSSIYSLRTTSSIVVNGTVCVMSDRRLKGSIEPLVPAACKSFIENTNPVSFSHTNDPLKISHNVLIAQDVAHTEIAEHVKVAPYPGLPTEVAGGFVSPGNVGKVHYRSTPDQFTQIDHVTNS
ncbi:hypothetical protein FI667_g14059, partial [Globisporangium splendens]